MLSGVCPARLRAPGPSTASSRLSLIFWSVSTGAAKWTAALAPRLGCIGDQTKKTQTNPGRSLFDHFLFFLFFYYSINSVLFCISFMYTAQGPDDHVLYKVPPGHFQYPPGTTPSYYIIIDYIPYAVLYIL